MRAAEFAQGEKRIVPVCGGITASHTGRDCLK